MTFDGIPTSALDFFEDLEADNTKTFWTAHKHLYDEHVKAPIEALAAALEPEFGAPKVFRPYRDVRFSKDKTPYKDHQGVVFAETSRYFHVSAAGLFVAAGYWQTSSPQVSRLRRAIDDDVAGPALERAVAAVRKAGFELNDAQLTRVPSGFDKDHERGDLLRRKTMTGHRDYGSPAWLATPRAKGQLVKAFRALAPLVTWLETHVGHD